MNSTMWCMSVYIINDAIPEMDETFTVSLSEVPTTTDGCANMSANSSVDNISGSGSIDQALTMKDVLEPMEPIFSGTAIITIVDDDFIGELVLCVLLQ